jgi:hypothetical protein
VAIAFPVPYAQAVARSNYVGRTQVLQITDINRRKIFELACIFGYHSCLGDASYTKLAKRLGGPSTNKDWHRRAVKISFLHQKWGQDFYVKFGYIWPPTPSRTVLVELTEWIHIPLDEAKTYLQAGLREADYGFDDERD